MNNNQGTGRNDDQLGAEILIKLLSGRCMLAGDQDSLKTIDKLEDMTLTGRYMSLQLQRLFVNINLKNSDAENIRSFTILEVLFHNIWDFRLDIYPSARSIKMIDSDGIQHDGGGCHYFDFSRVVLPEGRTIEAEFPWPETELEDHAKTKGWLWFDSLPKDVFPYRFVFQLSVFDPGCTSGGVNDEETLEFIIVDYDMKPIEEFVA